MTPAPDSWFVQFDGLSYGPFSPAQMQDFVAEQRVIATSLITTDPSRGYFQAAVFPQFEQWQSVPQALPAMGQTAHMPVAQSQPVPVAVGQTYAPTPAQAPSPAILLVMAEIRSAQGMPFLHALQAHGTAQRIGDTVWLLRASLTAEALCDALSATLSKQDRLFVLDSFNNRTAWFNIGADMGERIREIWEDVT